MANVTTVTKDDATSVVELGTGDSLNFYASGIQGQLGRLRHGTAAAPVTTTGPTLKVSRTMDTTRATIEAAGGVGTSGPDQLATIMGISSGVGSSEVQSTGLAGFGVNTSANSLGGTGSSPDACGVHGTGRISTTGVGVAIGGFFLGRLENDLGSLTGVEVASGNYGTTDQVYNPNGFGRAQGMWITAPGNAKSSTGIVFGKPSGRQSFDVGIGFTTQNPVATTTIRDDGAAATSLAVNGTHATAAIAVAAGAGNVGIGVTAPTYKLTVQAESTTLPTFVVRRVASQTSNLLSLRDETNAEIISFGPSGHLRTPNGTVAFPSHSFGTDSASGMYSLGAAQIGFGVGGALKVMIGTGGAQIGDTFGFGGGVGVLGLGNATTVPNGNPSGGGVLYVESGSLKFRGSSGTVSVLAAA
jgi:hypothetical protein